MLQQTKKGKLKYLSVIFWSAVLMYLTPSLSAEAFELSWLSFGASGGIAGALCTVVGWFNGPVGQAIASLSIIFLGISAFFGKVTWGMAIMFAAGIIAIFNSADIVRAITLGRAGGCCDINIDVGSLPILGDIVGGSVGFGCD